LRIFQHWVNVLYRHPKSNLKKYKKLGGYRNYRRMLRGSRAMAKAAELLPPVQSDPAGLPVYFLTGRDFLYQTLFCIRSLSLVTTERFNFILIDDGTFNQSMIERIRRQVPGAGIITAKQIDLQLEAMLPERLFPKLHEKRRVYPHIKKLTDIHCLAENEWKLVLDSDMLFWEEPKAMIEWLRLPAQPLHMVDCADSYGYTMRLMESLAGPGLRRLVNVGAIGLRSRSIDWTALESWIKKMEEQEGASYYLEQAISAMLIGNRPARELSATDYFVNPSPAVAQHRTGVLHHYVDFSKLPYFTELWKVLVR